MLKPQINSPDYQLHLPPLGEGTFGTVYRATYRGVVDRAVKVFKPSAVDLPSMMQELEKLSTVSEHQGIVTLHDFDLRGEVPYYVMSLHADQAKDGTWKARTLEDLCGKVDAREAGRLIDQIADAMAYLHRNQVLHCDLKPRNIMLTNETPPNIKICDFGQSRGVRLARMAGWGTPFYSSPEQLMHPDDWLNGKGFLWDVYSFGVVAFRLITGRFPRLHELASSGSPESRESTVEDPDSVETEEGDRSDERMEQIVTLIGSEPEIQWPAQARIDRRRKWIITRCLALDPAQRLRDMRDVRNTVFRQIQESRAVRSRNVAVLFGAISALALGASGKAWVEANRVREANAREEARRQEAEELVNFIVHNLAEDLEPAGRAELLEHIAENAATYFANMAGDARTERSLQSFVKVLETRGLAALARGDAKLAVDSYRKAYNLLVQMEKEGEGAPGLRAAEALEKLGEAQLLAGSAVPAQAAFQQALRVWELAPDAPEVWLARARLHRRLAGMARTGGDLTATSQHIAKAREIYERVVPGTSKSRQREYLDGFLGVFVEEGELLVSLGEAAKAAAAFQRVTAKSSSDAAVIGKDAGFMRLVAQAWRGLGEMALANPAEGAVVARSCFEKELELRESVYWREPADPVRALALARCLHALVSCSPSEASEERHLAQSRLRLALRSLDGVREAAKSDPELKKLREDCAKRLEEVKQGKGVTPLQGAATRPNGGT